MSAELFATVMIVAVILVAMISYLGMIKSKDWKNRYHSLLDRYDDAYKQLNTQRNLNNALSTKITQLEKKIKCLEIELKQEKKRNGTNTSIDKTNSIKEEVSRLKGSEHISRSKAVRYITQHSNFTPTQMNNQSTDSILDYYWYLYLMNAISTENSTSSTNSDNSTVNEDKSGYDVVEGTIYDSNEVSYNKNNYSVEEMRSFASNSSDSTHNIVSDEHGQITSIPNDVYAEKLFNHGKTFGNYDESSKSSDSSSSDDSLDNSSSHYSGSSFSSSGSSHSDWGSSDYSSSSSYDSGSSSSWGSSDSSSCDCGGGDW